MRKIGVALCAFLTISIASIGAAHAQVDDPVRAIEGRWEIFNIETGEVVQPCEFPQVFKPTEDGRYVDLSQSGESGEERLARYIVLQPESGRALMYIENETRLTALGDPVLWWAVFSSPDAFRWRRYDWPKGAATPAEWRRCPAEPAN